jgi:hypothetical protein
MRLSGFLDAAADLCESLSGTYQMELGRELMEFSMPDRLDPPPTADRRITQERSFGPVYQRRMHMRM